MKIWKVRGTQKGKSVEQIIPAADWLGAVQAAGTGWNAMTVREAMLLGLPEVLASRLCAKHGWTVDGAAPTVVSREYPTAVGMKLAVVRSVVPDNGLAQIWLKAEYQSEGRNALAGCAVYISQDADLTTIYSHVDEFVAQVDAAVAETYAARLLAA